MAVQVQSSYVVPADVGPVTLESSDVGFWDAFKATFSYQYRPLLDRVGEEYEFGRQPYDPSFDPLTPDHYAGYEDYLNDLARARNADHLAFIKSDIDARLQTKQTLEEAGFWSGGVWVASLIDPLNVAFALPVFGQLGLMAKGGMTIRQAAAASARGSLAAGAASEFVRAPFDRTNTFTESGLNLAATTAIGTILGSAPSVARGAFNSAKKSAAMRNEIYQNKGSLPEDFGGYKIKYSEAPEAEGVPARGITIADKNITIDRDVLSKEFDQRPWVLPEVEGAKPYLEADFKTPQEWGDFQLQRQVVRDQNKRQPGESVASYADRTNKIAYDRMAAGNDIAETPFTSSVAYKILTTPGKRIMADGTPKMKRAYHLLAGVDQYRTAGVEAGKTQHQSVSRQAKTHVARSVNTLSKMEQLWAQDQMGRGLTTKVLGYNTDNIAARMNQKQTFDAWFQTIVDAKLMNAAGRRDLSELSPQNQQAVKELDKFFKDYQLDLQDLNLLNTPARIKERADEARAAGKNELATYLDDLIELGFNERYQFPIYYNKALLLRDENARLDLERIFADWIRNHPIKKMYNEQTRKFESVSSTKSPEAIAKDAVAAILEEGEPVTLIDMVAGAPKGKHLRHRMIDIPEHLISDYIIKEPSVLHSYAQRVGKRMEFVRNFGNRSIDDILDEFEVDMREAGYSEKKIQSLRQDFLFDYERTMGEYVRNPDRFDAQIGKAIKEMAGMAYLDAAALASVTDMGNIVMERGMRGLLGPMRTDVDRGLMKLARNNVKLTGEATELALGGAQQRWIADNIEGITPNLQERIFNPLTRAYYNIPVLGNGLGALTYVMKKIDGVYRSGYYMDTLIKWSQGTAKTADVQYMLRMGFSEEDAKIIASYPHQKGDRYIYANVDEWPASTKQERELLLRWNTAMNAGIGNTILHATSFDKPRVMDGVVYARYRPWMKQLGLEIDERASSSTIKVTRLETQALTMPFQFFNFMLGATNRITAGMFDPMKQHRLVGGMALIMLGYASLKLKKFGQPWWFEQRDSAEILQRSIDASGLFGVYGEVAYVATHAAIGSGMLDPDDSLLRPKYNPGIDDVLTEPLGAAPGMIWAWAKAGQEFFNGNDTEAARQFGYNFPTTPLISFAQDWFQ